MEAIYLIKKKKKEKQRLKKKKQSKEYNYLQRKKICHQLTICATIEGFLTAQA